MMVEKTNQRLKDHEKAIMAWKGGNIEADLLKVSRPANAEANQKKKMLRVRAYVGLCFESPTTVLLPTSSFTP